jgi:hypothetical protein
LRKLGIILLAFLLLILLTTRSGPSAVPTTYNPFDTSWKGCSDFFRILQENYGAKLLTTDYSVLKQYRHGVLIILGPTEKFSEHETQQLIEFVKENGILIVVADIDGTGSSLNLFGARILPVLLRDPGSYEKRPDFVVLKDLRGEMFSGVSRILTNCPAYIWTEPRPRPTPLGLPTIEAVACSSRQAYPDVNMNGTQDSNELSGSYPVIVALHYSDAQGKVVLIADPGIFINDIIQRNIPFVHSLMKWAGCAEKISFEGESFVLPMGRAVLIDLTHSGHKPELWLWSAWLTDKLLPICLVTIAAVVWAGWPRRRKLVSRPEGRLIKEMREYAKLSKSKSRSDFSFPLLTCYYHFLRRCARLMGVEPNVEEVLNALRSNLPKETKAVKTLATCHLVDQGVLSVDVETAERLIKELNEIEKKVEAWSRR